MEKKQYDLLKEILKKFNEVGILHYFILIGSQCYYLYNDYFLNTSYTRRISPRTRDVDFLISDPKSITNEVDIPSLLKELGFIMDFRGNKGYIKLIHPDLLVEFLVPEKGRGTDRPVSLPKLGINAVALRFLNFLIHNTIKVKIDDFYVILPHPANFALHKLIIFQRRTREEKAIKDRDAAIETLRALIAKREEKHIRQAFNSIPKKWQKKIIKGLEEAQEKDILEILR